MIDIEAAVLNKFPGFANKPSLIRKPAISFLRKLIHEKQVNAFLTDHKDSKGIDFVDGVLNYFNFSSHISTKSLNNIPLTGRVVVIANHPIGSLDGLAILKLLYGIRKDVRIIANDMLMLFEGLQELLIPLDNMTGGSARKAYKKIRDALEKEEVIIVFPAGEVSRAGAKGIRDGDWMPGFLHFARRSNAPLLPIHIEAKNSWSFYILSMLYKPLGTALLSHEMFNKQNRSATFTAGELIPSHALESDSMHDRTLVKRLKSHLYIVGQNEKRSKAKPVIFETEKPLIAPQDPHEVYSELQSAQEIGITRDGNHIFLAKCETKTALLLELGRLRELTFRMVGEGTGKACDIDEFDHHYTHLILWDEKNREIAGAYRLGEGKTIMPERGEKGFYTSTLYRFNPSFQSFLERGCELGRTFVNPKYWGRASLDYLWQGLGAYLAQNPDIRYLIGPISMSADYSKELMDTLAYFYGRYHGCETDYASAYHPYTMSTNARNRLEKLFENKDRVEAFDVMQKQFSEKDRQLPMLYKQYASLYTEGGFQSIVFSVDPDFGDCMDGLFISDITKLKPEKRKRYIRSRF